MDKQMIEKLGNAISNGVDKLAPSVQEMIRQYQMAGLVEAIASIVMTIVAGVAIWMSVKGIIKTYKSNSFYDSDADMVAFFLGVFIIVLFFFVGFGIAGTVGGIQKYVAPIPMLLGK